MQLEWAFRNYIIIKLDTSPNSTHVNVFEMAGIDPKKVKENTKLINDLINSMKE